MIKRTRVVVAVVTVVALATSGTASAATSGSDPKPGAGKSGAVVKAGEKSKPADRGDLAAVAAKLGVTVARLEGALVAAKRSLAGSARVTPDMFVRAVAAKLGLPVARVRAAVEPMILKPGRDDKRGGKHDKGADDPRKSPFASNAAAARLAAGLGVSQAKAKAALLALVSMPNGIAPDSKAFREVAAKLGVSADRLQAGLVRLKQSLANG
ncbi:hypothetical protein OHA10_06420 [Kribbella sp. NBC_00662]|uniref:hypothetical protein n=1 Tax=Kribbella sp. NBC_00662 TaxID=2975969 RepID=UPI00325309F1